MLGKFHAFVSDFFQNKSFRTTTRVSNGLDPDSVILDLHPNCLQRYQQTTKVAASKERA